MSLHPHRRSPTDIYLHEGDGIDLETFVSEPDEKDPQWFPSAYGRMVVLSSGPLLICDGPVPDPLPVGYRRMEESKIVGIPADSDREDARVKLWPALGRLSDLAIGVGSPAPRYVFVGERSPKEDTLPFCSRSGVWLLLALRRLNIDELSCYWTNAYGPERNPKRRVEELQELHELFGRYDPQWVFLGREAEKVAKSAGIDHAYAHHPMWARRFHFDPDGYEDGPAFYAEHLQEAGIQREEEVEEFGYLVEDAPEELLHHAGVSSVAYRATAQKKTTGRLANEVVRRARIIYVTGRDPNTGDKVPEADTMTAVAKHLGVPPHQVWRAAREADPHWEVQRDEYRRKVDEESIAKLAELETKTLTECRKMSMHSTVMAYRTVSRRLQTGDLTPGTKDLQRLLDAMLTLMKLGDPIAEDEMAQMRDMPIVELHQRLGDRIREQFGEDAV